MTLNEIMDQEVYGSKVKQTLIKKMNGFICWSNYTSINEFEGMFLAMTSRQVKELESMINIPKMAC